MLQFQSYCLRQNPALASAVMQTASLRCNSPWSPKALPESIRRDVPFRKHPEGTSSCHVSCVLLLKLRDIEIPCCLSVWPKSHLTLFWCASCSFPVNSIRTLTWDWPKVTFGLELPQILRAFSLILISYRKHQNRLSTGVLLGCFNSHSDYFSTPLRHKSSILSAHGLIKIGGNKLLNYTGGDSV